MCVSVGGKRGHLRYMNLLTQQEHNKRPQLYKQWCEAPDRSNQLFLHLFNFIKTIAAINCRYFDF